MRGVYVVIDIAERQQKTRIQQERRGGRKCDLARVISALGPYVVVLPVC